MSQQVTGKTWYLSAELRC